MNNDGRLGICSSKGLFAQRVHSLWENSGPPLLIKTVQPRLIEVTESCIWQTFSTTCAALQLEFDRCKGAKEATVLFVHLTVGDYLVSSDELGSEILLLITNFASILRREIDALRLCVWHA